MTFHDFLQTSLKGHNFIVNNKYVNNNGKYN